MATFQERFKGKTTVMGRQGLESVLNTCQQPIQKDYSNMQIPSNSNRPPIHQPLVNIHYTQQANMTAPLYSHNPYLPQQQIHDSLQYLSQQQYFNQYQNFQIQPVPQTEPSKKQEQRSKSAKQPLQSDESTRYKPYTIKDYETMKKTANTKLGGLGPNLSGEEWNKEKEKMLKRQEFAEQVRQFNSANIITTKVREQKLTEMNSRYLDMQLRTKAMEFAKNIPKPPPSKRKEEVVVKKPNSDPFDDEIARLEKEHLKYLNQLDKMK